MKHRTPFYLLLTLALCAVAIRTQGASDQLKVRFVEQLEGSTLAACPYQKVELELSMPDSVVAAVDHFLDHKPGINPFDPAQISVDGLHLGKPGFIAVAVLLEEQILMLNEQGVFVDVG